MSVVYLTDQGATLAKRGRRLVVEKAGTAIRYFHAHQVRQLVVMGQIHLSSHTLVFLIEQGIDTVFLSFNGKYRGRLTSDHSKNIELRRAQFRMMDAPDQVIQLARLCVSGKIQNCRVLLRRHRDRLNDPELRNAVNRLRSSLIAVDKADNPDSLRGVEGQAAKVYFHGLGRLLADTEFSFDRRTRRPPRDPVNALLSFGYTLLGNAVETAVQAAGLEPYLGALHATHYGHPSLVLDLMEEFRPLVVDAVVVAALRRKSLTLQDFYFNPDAEVPPEGQETAGLERHELPVLLTHEGIKKTVALHERRLADQYFYQPREMSLTYRDIILAQARLLGRHFAGQETYAPFVWR